MTTDNEDTALGLMEGLELPVDQIIAEPSEEFVLTPFIEEIVGRAIGYLEIGCPIHLSGPAGSGKTTLAFHLAARRGRPITLIHGDDEFMSSDLIGNDYGYRRSRLVDNYIHSVCRTEEELRSLWVDNRLTTACRNGDTLIYDEFTRSRPEANNVLLSILEEGILNLPRLRRSNESYIEVHPAFRAIFTSNPEEYAGIHKTQDALMDRLVTVTLDHYDADTEARIIAARSGLAISEAQTIARVVREVRGLGERNHRPTIRSGVVIARMLAHRGARPALGDQVFWGVCRDVLHTDSVRLSRKGKSAMQERIARAIRKVCGPPHRSNGRGHGNAKS